MRRYSVPFPVRTPFCIYVDTVHAVSFVHGDFKGYNAAILPMVLAAARQCGYDRMTGFGDVAIGKCIRDAIREGARNDASIFPALPSPP